MAAVCECVCVFVRMCACVQQAHICHTLRTHYGLLYLCLFYSEAWIWIFFCPSLGAKKKKQKMLGKKNVQHTLLRTSRPEATALYGFIFFNILARKILYYIEGKIHAQRLPSNGHVNFICFLRAHKSKKIVFYKKIYVRCPFQWPDILYILCGRRPFSADILTERRNSNPGKYTENLSWSSINPQPPQLCMHWIRLRSTAVDGYPINSRV